MPIYFRALLVCDRCDAEMSMDDVSTESEVEQRLRNGDSRWADDENGETVCGDCWDKWERTHPMGGALALAKEDQ
jgi:hypothetical protein